MPIGYVTESKSTDYKKRRQAELKIKQFYSNGVEAKNMLFAGIIMYDSSFALKSGVSIIEVRF